MKNRKSEVRNRRSEKSRIWNKNIQDFKKWNLELENLYRIKNQKVCNLVFLVHILEEMKRED